MKEVFFIMRKIDAFQKLSKITVFLILAALLGVGGCQQKGLLKEKGRCQTDSESVKMEEKDGPYGFTSRYRAFPSEWYEYYETGVSFAEGCHWEEAVEYLNLAIKRRYEDQRRARTYGRHLIDYFPHRELGIVYYRTKKMRDAEKELELSLSQYPSDKARVYLDITRVAIIQDDVKKGRIKKTQPKITFLFDEYKNNPDYLLKPFFGEKKKGTLKYEIWTRKGDDYDPIIISGEVTDEQYVTSPIIIGDKSFHFEEYNEEYALQNARQQVNFRQYLTLAEGKNTIKVEARNLMKGENSKEIIIHVDKEGPMIAIEEWTLSGDEVAFNGSLYDDTGVSKFFIKTDQGKKFDLFPFITFARNTDDKMVTFNFNGKLPFETSNLNLIAIDELQNEKEISFSSSTPSYPKNNKPTLFASLTFNTLKNVPSIGLETNLDESQMVYRRNISFNFTAESYTHKNYNMKLKIINCSIFLTTPSENTPKKVREFITPSKKMEYTPFIRNLEDGENTITIRAENEIGEVEEVEYFIRKETTNSEKIFNRLSILIFPFGYRDSINIDEEKVTEVSKKFQEVLIDAFRNENRFDDMHMHLEDDEIENYMKKLKLERIDEKNAISLGRKIFYFQFRERDITELERKGIKLDRDYWLYKEYRKQDEDIFLNELKGRLETATFNQHKQELLSKAHKTADYVIIGSLINHSEKNSYEANAKLVDIGESNQIQPSIKDVYEEIGDWKTISENISKNIAARYCMEFPLIKSLINEPPRKNNITIPVTHTKLYKNKKLIVFKKNEKKGDGYVLNQIFGKTEAKVETIADKIPKEKDFVITK